MVIRLYGTVLNRDPDPERVVVEGPVSKMRHWESFSLSDGAEIVGEGKAMNVCPSVRLGRAKLVPGKKSLIYWIRVVDNYLTLLLSHRATFIAVHFYVAERTKAFGIFAAS